MRPANSDRLYTRDWTWPNGIKSCMVRYGKLHYNYNTLSGQECNRE